MQEQDLMALALILSCSTTISYSAELWARQSGFGMKGDIQDMPK